MPTASVVFMAQWKAEEANRRLLGVAKEYVRRFIEYGVENASLWSQDHVSEQEASQFTRYIREEMRKHGFRSGG